MDVAIDGHAEGPSRGRAIAAAALSNDLQTGDVHRRNERCQRSLANACGGVRWMRPGGGALAVIVRGDRA
jgi:hypothetical protein